MTIVVTRGPAHRDLVKGLEEPLEPGRSAREALKLIFAADEGAVTQRKAELRVRKAFHDLDRWLYVDGVDGLCSICPNVPMLRPSSSGGRHVAN
jgi:hypothetical protein